MSFQDLFVYIVWAFILLTGLYQLSRCLRIVPQRYALIKERLGKYHMTLNSGFHILIPWFDRIAMTLDLKEEAIDVPPQECFTTDEVKVTVDGVIYLSVVDPVRAAYGVTDYRWAAMQLAQTTTRSTIGKITLDRTFEEREFISASVVNVLEQTSQEWGIRVHRYEIKNITPPESVKHAMEKQVRAERQRRAMVAKAEGERQSRINRSEGLKQEMINHSEGDRQRLINEASGLAQEIRSVAEATAQSLEQVARAIRSPGGKEALQLRLTEQYVSQLTHLAKEETKLVLPFDMSSIHEIRRKITL